MYINKANDILISLSDGKYDFLEDKSNSKFFDFEPNDDFKELTKNMKQTNKIMEHLQKEEESLHEKRKDDPELDKNMKDFEKKMFKNPKFTDINGNPVDLNNLDFTTDREERLKKERENNKNKNKKMQGKHENKNLEDAEFNFKDLIAHPNKYNKVTASGSASYINNIKFDKQTGAVADGLSLSLKLDKIQEEEKYDGYYSIVTSELNMSDKDLRNKYRGLSKIEETFKITKSELHARPVLVWTPDHIESHFLTCFVSLVITRLLENKLKNKYSIHKIICY